ncbi:MAG: hypothetical protein NWE93_06400 [Candidatus Bathyarchaeota archaeon]|nr:hypothetical protein [Candidatus Bathyarchaeota archaeon]
MRRRFAVSSTLAVLVAAMLTAAVILASANPTPAASTGAVVTHGNGGIVTLALPPSSSHPVNLRISVVDVSNESDYGGPDVMEIYVWVPNMNSYVPVAILSTNTNASAIDWIKQVVNGTPIWTPPTMPNYFTPNASQLQVWMDDDGVLMVNLTTSVNVTLPSALGGNFTIPPMTMMLRPIATGFAHNESLTLAKPTYSGWTINMTHTDVPAWVRVQIPMWLGTAPVETVGTIITDGTTTYTPPAS